MPTPPTPMQSPPVEMVARVWHALSDEAIDGIAFNGNGCTCRYHATHAKQVVEVFTGQPIPEPDGLGAVVVNPFTDQAWVRAAHPALPWKGPDNPPQEWCDPTSEDWYTWADLPGPLVLQAPGWTPPPPTPGAARPEPAVPEPVGLGAVAVDAASRTWVRSHDGPRPWVRADDTYGQAAWDDLPQPVLVRSPGWVRL